MKALAEAFPVYVTMSLRNEALTLHGRSRLERLGLDEIFDGKPYQAFEIVSSIDSIMNRIEADPEVKSVEVGSPPCHI